MPTYYWTDTSQNFYTYGWPDGLNAGVYYNITVSGYDVNGVWETIGSCSFTTNNIGVPTNLSTTVDGLKITLNYTTDAYATEIQLSLFNGSTPVYSVSPSTSYIQVYTASIPGNSENWRIRARLNSSSAWTSWSSYQNYTTGAIAPGTPTSEVVCTSAQDGGLSLSWGTSQYATSYDLIYWYLVNGTLAGSTTVSVSSANKTLTGLNYGTTYYFNVRGVNSAGSSNWASSNPPAATVRPKPPTINSSNITQTSVRITESGMSGKWNTITVYQYESDGVTLKATGMITNGVGTYIDFTNLTAGTTYIFKAKSTVASDGGTTLDSLSYSSNLSVTAAANNRPAYFNWTYAKWVKGASNPVLGSEKTFEGATDIYVVAGNVNNPIEWYALIRNVQAMYTYKGSGAITPTMTDVTAGTTILASQYKQVKDAIVWLYNQAFPSNQISIADKTEDIINILASDFNILREKLNGIT